VASRRIENLEDRLQPFCRYLGAPGDLRYDTDPALPAEGDEDPCTDSGRHRSRLRREIVEKPAQRCVERHPDDLGHSFVRDKLNQ